jgi:DNA-binding response OmpR family regulator
MEGKAQVPVLIITSDNKEETRLKGFELGAQDFIPKPFERENLFPRVRRFIG